VCESQINHLSVYIVYEEPKLQEWVGFSRRKKTYQLQAVNQCYHDFDKAVFRKANSRESLFRFNNKFHYLAIVIMLSYSRRVRP
jgi:hypothetical protein